MWSDLRRRVNRLIVSAELAPPAFLISNIPVEARWETVPFGTLLSLQHIPIGVCVVGQLRDIAVLHGEDMVPRAEVDLALLRDADLEATHALLRMANPPPSPHRLPRSLIASKRMSALRSVSRFICQCRSLCID